MHRIPRALVPGLGFLCFIVATLAQPDSQPVLITLSGSVLEGGAAPESPVKVELVCNARVIRVTYTRVEGSFHFRLGEQRRSTDISAGTSGPDSLETGQRGIGGIKAGGELRTSGDGRFDLTNCDIRLSLMPGKQSSRIPLGIVSEFDTNVGVLLIRDLPIARGAQVSVTTLEAPTDARKAFEKAQRDLAREKPDHGRAQKRLLKAVRIFPEFADAWSLLGEAQLGLNNPEAARSSFERAIKEDPSLVRPYEMLAGMELEMYRYERALELTRTLLELAPTHSKGRYYDGLAHYSLAHYPRALESLSVVEENGASAEFPAALLMMGDIMARQGEVATAAEKIRRYLEIGQHSEQMGEQLRKQLRDWEEKGLIEPAGNQ